MSPYIRKDERKAYDNLVTEIEKNLASVVRENFSGHLNYVITKLISEIIYRWPQNYDFFNTIVGVLDNVKDEFKRRILNPYEDYKIKENGDVY